MLSRNAGISAGWGGPQVIGSVYIQIWAIVPRLLDPAPPTCND